MFGCVHKGILIEMISNYAESTFAVTATVVAYNPSCHLATEIRVAGRN